MTFFPQRLVDRLTRTGAAGQGADESTWSPTENVAVRLYRYAALQRDELPGTGLMTLSTIDAFCQSTKVDKKVAMAAYAQIIDGRDPVSDLAALAHQRHWFHGEKNAYVRDGTKQQKIAAAQLGWSMEDVTEVMSLLNEQAPLLVTCPGVICRVPRK